LASSSAQANAVHRRRTNNKCRQVDGKKPNKIRSANAKEEQERGINKMDVQKN